MLRVCNYVCKFDGVETKDDRLRVTLDDPYAHALGLALFCFARMEWDAIYCCEKIDAGLKGLFTDAADALRARRKLMINPGILELHAREFFSGGRIPWRLSTADLARLFGQHESQAPLSTKLLAEPGR